MLDVINGMVPLGAMFREGHNQPLTEIVLGGWSWQAGEFLPWRLFWSPTEMQFRHESIPRRTVGKFVFIGDRDDVNHEWDAVRRARRRLRELLLERGGLPGPLDMEPFEVLVEIIREGRWDTIGGAPQLAKVYRHMNTQFFAVRWPDAQGQLTYGGRPILDYEEFDVPVLDPDEPQFHARGVREGDAVLGTSRYYWGLSRALGKQR